MESKTALNDEELAKLEAQSKFSLKTLEVYQKRTQEKKKQGWIKSLLVGSPQYGCQTLDDYFALRGAKCHKVKSFTVMLEQYVCGIQFTYQVFDPVTLEKTEVVQGYVLKGNQKEIRHQETFELEDDEYVTALIGRKGLCIDQFGVRTSKGRELKYGGEGGGPYSHNAPKGYHYSTFAANLGGDLHAFYADLHAIPKSNEIKTYSGFNAQKFFQRKIALFVAEYLTIGDMLNLFCVNRSFSLFRFNEQVISNISRKCIFAGYSNVIKYVKKLLRHSGVPNHKNFQYTNELLQIAQNCIKNSDSQYQLEGWEVTQNGGDGIKPTGECFMTSYAYSEIMFEKKFSEIFDDQTVQTIMNDAACIVAGASFQDSGFGGTGVCRLSILDSNKQPVFDKSSTSNQLSKNGTYLNHIFRNTENHKDLAYVQFRVGGKDQKWWAGHFGPRISKIYLRCLPIRDVHERLLLKQVHAGKE